MEHDLSLLPDAEVEVVASLGAAGNERARALHAQARANAARALAEKDALHRELKPSHFETQQSTIEAAWHKAEIALHAELVSWVQAHGSEALQARVRQALSAGRQGTVEWRPDEPLDWGQAERISALQPHVAKEWMAMHRPGWVVWNPLSREERQSMETLREVEPEAFFEHRYLFTNPEAAYPEAAWNRIPRAGVPDILKTSPVAELLAAARRTEPAASLATYEPRTYSGGRTEYYCATVQLRLPGGYEAIQIALPESAEQARKLDAMAIILSAGDRRTYAEQLAAMLEVEFASPLVAVGQTQAAEGQLQRIDTGGTVPRAIVVRDDAVHLLIVSDTTLQSAVGQEVLLGCSGQQVFVQASNAAVVVAHDDLDALQQLAIRPELTRLAELAEREPPTAGFLQLLDSASRRAEQRLADCRRIEHGQPRPADSFFEPPPTTLRALRDSALETERLAWAAAHGSPELARASIAELAESMRSEWLRTHPGWSAKTVDDVGWKRVAADGPNTLHPAATMRTTPAVVELMSDAVSHAPDAFLAAERPTQGAPGRATAIPPRPRHCAVMTRRMPGSLEPEALFYHETPQQKVALDTAWRERHSVVHKLGARMQREFGLPLAEQHIGETLQVEGQLVAIERGEDNRHRAVIATPSHLHIVSVSPSAHQQLVIGRGVTLEKTAGRMRLVQAPEKALLAERVLSHARLPEVALER